MTCEHESLVTAKTIANTNITTFCGDCGAEMEGQGPDKNGQETFEAVERC